MRLFIFLSIFFSSALVWGQFEFPDSTNYRRNINNPEKDSFCPRLEGSYPEHCCPYKEKGPRPCYYFHTDTVSIGMQGSKTSCVNGEDATVSCCNRSPRSCVRDLVIKPFIQRQIKRPFPTNSSPKKCGFEACPNAPYWKNDNLGSRAVSHQNPSASLCNVVIQEDQCASTDLPNCSSLEPCPLPQPDPQPPQPPQPQPPQPQPPQPQPPEPQPPQPQPPQPQPPQPQPPQPQPPQPQPPQPQPPPPEE